MREQPSHLGIYRANLTSPEHRHFITVARSRMVEDTLETLRGSASRKSKHHMLFIGPRGIGKTHLLSLIEDGIGAETSDHTVASIVSKHRSSNRGRSVAWSVDCIFPAVSHFETETATIDRQLLIQIAESWERNT